MKEQEFCNWAPPGVMKEQFTEANYRPSRADGRFERSLGFVMDYLRRMRPKLGFEQVSCAEEFGPWREKVKAKLRELLRMREELVVEFKLLSEEPRDGYNLCRYEFYPEPGLVIPILVLVPDCARQPGAKVPAVICSPGSAAGLNSLAGEPDRCFNRYRKRNKQAWFYAQAGMVGVAIENPATAFNSEPEIEYGQVQTRFFSLLAMTGRNYQGFVTEQRLMVVEFLKRLPFVDAKRIAVSGLSLGCGGVLYAALMSDDIAAAVYNDFVCSALIRTISTTDTATGPTLASARMASNEWFDVQPDLMAALAPKPLLLDEGGPWKGHLDKIVQAYGFSGHPENLQITYYPKYADPSSRIHDHEDLREVRGLTPGQYLEYANVDASQHSFHSEVAVPWLMRQFYGHDDMSPKLRAAIEEAVAEKCWKPK